MAKQETLLLSTLRLGNYVTTSYAALKLDVTRQRVHQWVQDGTLKHKRLGRSILIDEQSMRELASRRAELYSDPNRRGRW